VRIAPEHTRCFDGAAVGEIGAGARRRREFAAFDAGTTLAPRAGMRALALVLLAAPTAAARADEPPILRLELRLAAGAVVDHQAALRMLPFSVGAAAEHAFMAQPWTSVWGDVFIEGPDHLVGGVGGGLRVRAAGGAVRLSGGGTALVGPDLMAGATVMLGGCFASETPGLCVDVEGSLFFVGGGVPDGGAGQLKLVLGMGFDVL
jgi:hypothetical protein